MKNGAKGKVVFKQYTNKQLMLIPPSVDELIDKDHPVRTVDRVIDEIDIEALTSQYSGGGASSYDPRMLLKVVIYAYLSNIFSSRKIEAALKENIHFMWLAGMSRPDHNTINRFRSGRLTGSLKEIFCEVVKMLVGAGLVSLSEIYVDGTKIEANANRYSFVWAKSVKRNEERIAAQLKELWEYTQKVAAEELADTSDESFAKVDPEMVKATVEKINKALADKPVDAKVKQKLNYAKKNWPKNLEKYQGYKETLGKRNSFSKTDPDATFMRMKDDHMKNGQLKPGYNLQISTNNQFIVNYTHHPNPTDTTTLVPHLEEHKRLYHSLPEVAVADAGYGSEENYVTLEKCGIEAYIKYNTFHRDLKAKEKKNFDYDEQNDCVYCPARRLMERIGSRYRKSDNGFVQEYARYKSVGCQGCSLREQCCRNDEDKTIDINHRLVALRERAREKLTSEQGIIYRSRRCIEPETVFGNIKQNKGFRRFMLRGNAKIEVETGLLAIAHNIAKMAA
jgi:transposase